MHDFSSSLIENNGGCGSPVKINGFDNELTICNPIAHLNIATTGTPRLLNNNVDLIAYLYHSTEF